MHSGKAPLTYPTKTVMPQGTAVRYDANGLLVPVTDGNAPILGLTAVAVIDYNNRPREWDTNPELYIGYGYDPVMLNRPGALAKPWPTQFGTEATQGSDTANVGVWAEKDMLLQSDIRDEAGVPVAGLLPGADLVIGTTGLMVPKAGAGDTRVVVARVYQQSKGVGMPIPINQNLPTYIVKLTGNLG
jgi:hypothetical protein